MAKKNMTLEEKLEEAIVKDVPYEVPDNWIWVKLNGGFAECLDKFRKPVNSIERAKREGDVPYYGATGQVGFIDDYLTNENLVLVGEDGAPFFDILKNKAYIIDGKAWVNNHAHILKSYYGINGNKYLMNYLNIFNYNDYVNGTTRLKLTQSSMNNIPVPLPPIKEQQRIVDKIESLFEKLDKAKELIEEARDGFEKRKSAILEKAFSGELTKDWRKDNKGNIFDRNELFNKIREKRLSLVMSNKEKKDIDNAFIDYLFIDNSLPDGWIKLKSSMVCELITCGKTPTGNITSNGEIPYLKVYNIVNNKIDFEYKPQFIDYETHSKKLKSSMLRPNDVIMNIVGPPLKKIAIIPDTYSYWNMNQAIVRFRTIECVNYKYYYYCLIYDKTLRDVINETRGVVGQANISVSQSRNLDIIVPPIEEQIEIVRILDKLLEDESKIEELTQLEEQIELIKKSILAKAFRGELGTNCEEDESALELLKEILSK